MTFSTACTRTIRYASQSSTAVHQQRFPEEVDEANSRKPFHLHDADDRSAGFADLAGPPSGWSLALFLERVLDLCFSLVLAWSAEARSQYLPGVHRVDDIGWCGDRRHFHLRIKRKH